MHTTDRDGKATLPPTPPPAPPPCGELWQYTLRDGWQLVPDPLAQHPGDLDEQLAAARCECFGLWRRDDAGLSLAVHVTPADRYLVVLEGQTVFRVVAAADLPSLLTILPPLVAMVRDTWTLDAGEREFEERRRRRKQGPVYNAAKRCMEVVS